MFELAQVELHLRDLPVLGGPRERLAGAVLQVQVEHHVIERRVGAVAVPFPVLRAGVEFDAAAHHRRIGTVRETHRRFREIGSRLVVPHAELHDFHPFARGCRQEVGTEIPREPMGLQFQFALVGGELLGRSFAEHPVGGVQKGGVAVGKLHDGREGRYDVVPSRHSRGKPKPAHSGGHDAVAICVSRVASGRRRAHHPKSAVILSGVQRRRRTSQSGHSFDLLCLAAARSLRLEPTDDRSQERTTSGRQE